MYDELDSSRFLRTLCMCLRRYGLAETAGNHLGDLRAEEQDQRAVVNPYDDQDEGTRRARRAVAQPREVKAQHEFARGQQCRRDQRGSQPRCPPSNRTATTAQFDSFVSTAPRCAATWSVLSLLISYCGSSALARWVWPL